MTPKYIIFFDGSCGLCHRSVQFILRRDKKNIFYFSPIRSEFSNKILSNTDQSLDTFYLKYDQHIYSKSEAWLKTLYLLGAKWKFFSVVLSLLPNSLLDKSYDIIAKHRKSIFGEKENCDLLSKKQKDRFIF